MDEQERPDTTIGNGSIQTQILASENDPMEEPSKPSPDLTSIAPASIKPLSLPEALSLLQTNCFDLRSLGCELAILAKGKRLYVILAVPEGDLSVENGHVTLDGQPVSLG